MKHFFLLLFLSTGLAFCLSANQSPQQVTAGITSFSETELLTMKPREIVKKTGVKLNFFERLLIRKVQKKAKKAQDSSPKNPTTAIFLLGLVAFLSFPLALGSLAGIIIGGVAGLVGSILGLVYLGRGKRKKNAFFWIGLFLCLFVGLGMLGAALQGLFLS